MKNPVILLLLTTAISLTAADWPQFRGPNQIGVTTEDPAPAPWPKEGPKVLWRARVGTGSAGVAIVGEKLFTLGFKDGKDTVVCLSTKDGTVLWKHEYESDAMDTMHEGGPAATPAVAGNLVYTLSRDGLLHALETASGKVSWTTHLQREQKAPLPFFGFSFSPLITEGKVILPAGKPGSATFALQADDGNSLWKKGEDPAAYSTPVAAAFANTKGAVILNGAALIFQDLAEGKEFARYPFENPSPMKSYVNAATPLVIEKSIFITAAYGMGSVRIDVKEADGGFLFKEAWKTDEVAMQYSTPVFYNGHIYGFHTHDQGDSGGELVCLEWATGKVKWQQKNPGRGMLTLAAGKLLMLSRGGELILAEANPEKYTELSRSQIVGTTCRTDPVLADGKIYVKSANGELVCLNVK
jgi:outer membrane protein assembly factor BamB